MAGETMDISHASNTSSTKSASEGGKEEDAMDTESASEVSSGEREAVTVKASQSSKKLSMGAFTKVRRRSTIFEAIMSSEGMPGRKRAILELRHRLKTMMRRPITDVILGFIVIFDVWMTALGIDYRAAEEPEPGWMAIANNLCLTVYVLELVCEAFIKQSRFFKDPWQILDFLFVLAGLTELCVGAMDLSLDSIGVLRILRVARIARLVKLFRKFAMLKELRKLVQMASSCCKTLFWSFLFCFVIMSSFSMTAVEFMRPLVKDLVAQGVLDSCGDSCIKSMDSVTLATLYWFKTVIAGDGWGALAWPMMEQHPWTAVLFIGSHLVLVFGVLNMIVAVVVDTAAEQRMRDIKSLAEDLEAETETDLKFLEKVFRKVDVDGSGDVSFEELMSGAESIPEFSERLRVMDIDSRDLERLFTMLDEDGGGSIDLDEFRHALSRWMLNDSKTAARFAKHSVDAVQATITELGEQVEAIVAHLGISVDRRALIAGKPSKGEFADDDSFPGVEDSNEEIALVPSGSLEKSSSVNAGLMNGVVPSLKVDALGPWMGMVQRVADDMQSLEQRLEQVSLQRSSELLAAAVRNIQEELRTGLQTSSSHPSSSDQRLHGALLAELPGPCGSRGSPLPPPSNGLVSPRGEPTSQLPDLDPVQVEPEFLDATPVYRI